MGRRALTGGNFTVTVQDIPSDVTRKMVFFAARLAALANPNGPAEAPRSIAAECLDSRCFDDLREQIGVWTEMVRHETSKCSYRYARSVRRNQRGASTPRTAI